MEQEDIFAKGLAVSAIFSHHLRRLLSRWRGLSSSLEDFRKFGVHVMIKYGEQNRKGNPVVHAITGNAIKKFALERSGGNKRKNGRSFARFFEGTSGQT